MFGLKFIPPLVRTAMSMLIIGGLVGYVGTAFTTTLVADSGLMSGGGESSVAHKYVIAMLQRQSESISALSPSSDVVARARAAEPVAAAAGRETPHRDLPRRGLVGSDQRGDLRRGAPGRRRAVPVRLVRHHDRRRPGVARW